MQIFRTAMLTNQKTSQRMLRGVSSAVSQDCRLKTQLDVASHRFMKIGSQSNASEPREK
jgi:hypothetical protein